MSDSDSDSLSTTVFRFQGNGTTKVQAKGPNINCANISGLSFRNNNNNIMTSTKMNMPCNFDRTRQEDMVYDQRSVYMRDVTPMSVRNVSGLQAGMLQVPETQYRRFGGGSTRSVYYGRAVSPTASMGSVRTADSNITASDITNALKTNSFNKYDIRMIADALKKYKKGKTRRRVEKKRNVRKFLKGGRRVSGSESGEMASDSSISSEDTRSVRSCRTMQSVRSDFTNIRKLTYRDRNESFRQNSLYPPRSLEHGNYIPAIAHTHRLNNSSMMPLQNRYGGSSCSELQRDRINSSIMAQREKFQPGFNSSSMTQQERFRPGCNNSTMTQKERFETGFHLPSQRFHQLNSSIRRPPDLPSVDEHRILTSRSDDHLNKKRRISHNSASEPEDIFVEIPDEQFCRAPKRSLDDIDVTQPNKKKNKLSTPPNRMTNTKPQTPKQTRPAGEKSVGKKSPFVFAKPQLPISRLSKAKSISRKPSKPPQEPTAKLPKQTVTKQPPKTSSTKKTSNPNNKAPSTSSQPPNEVLISKSAQPLDQCPLSQSEPVANNETEKALECGQSESQNTTDLSMRPSFIKRKLFSQKVDVPDKNSSSESIDADSPGSTIYGKIQKEKNRARKIVASQSLMSRDVTANESNIMDLIYKIVPQDRMNATSVNRSETTIITKTNKVAPSDPVQWDVSSVIAGDAGQESDTFTDEEIFNDTVVNGIPNPKETGIIDKVHSTKKTNAVSKQIGSTKTVKQKTLAPGKPKASDKNEGQVNGQLKKDSKESGKKVRKLTQTTAKPANLKDKSREVSKPANEPNRMQPLSNQHNVSPGETSVLREFNKVHKCVKLFWDTDFESESEPERIAPPKPAECSKEDGTMAKKTANQTKQVFNKDRSHLDELNKTWSQRLFNKVPHVSIAINSTVSSISKPNNKVANEVVPEKSAAQISLTKHSNTKTSKKANPSENNKSQVVTNLPEKAKLQVEKFKTNKTKSSQKENTKPNMPVTETSRKIEKNIPPQKNDPKHDTKTSLTNVKKIAPQKNNVANNCQTVDDNPKNKVLVNNNTSRLRSKQKDSDKSIDSDWHCLSLRSRKIDLSLNSTTSSSKVERNLPKKLAATSKKKTKLKELKSHEVSNLSDMSFTLKTDHTPPYKKHEMTMSNTSFTRTRICVPPKRYMSVK